MAEQNHRLRPNGEAALLYAQALAAAGRPVDARTMLERVRASPFRSPAIDEVAKSILK